MKNVALLSVVALAAAAPAHGKEWAPATVCGSDRCNTVVERGELRALVIRGDRTLPPPAPARFYSVEFGAGETGWTVWYVPAAKAAAFVDETRRISWHPVEDAAAFERAARGLEPFPRPRVTSVRIGNRVVSDGASSYLRLFTQPVAGATGDPSLTDWVRVDLRSARPTPWTAGELEFSFSADGRLLERSWELVALPEATADAIATAQELPAATADRGSSLRLALPAAVAVAVALLAAVALRRRAAPRVRRRWYRVAASRARNAVRP